MGRRPTVIRLEMGLALWLGLLASPVAAQVEAEVEAEVEASLEGEAQTAEEDMQGGGMTEERQLNDEAARQHFRVATRYYDEGRFREAAQQFEEAYELSGRAELLYNAYIAHREAHQSADAAAMLERYLELVPDAPDRANLQARLQQLQLAIEANTEQQAALDAARLRADREAAARRDAEAQPEAWPWVVLGVGAAALIAGAITGPLALVESSSLGEECDGNGLCDPSVDIEGRRSTAKTFALATDILLIGGGTVAAVGLVLGLVLGLGAGGADAGAEADVEASASCGPFGCAATLRGRF